jgi:cystathionine beta-lyase
MALKSYRDDTLICHAGNSPQANHGVINPPVYHASTVLFPTLADLASAERNRYAKTTYGLFGTPTTFAFEEALAALEGQGKAMALPSGLAAITVTLLAFLKAGDHLLVADSAYRPTRIFCDDLLMRLGVETTYYDPCIGAGIDALIRPNTRMVYVESPGSLTFEIQDIPAIAAAAHGAGALVVADSTWATPLFLKSLGLGADIVVHAVTKYIAGHSDLMMGAIVAKDEHFHAIKTTGHRLGFAAAPDDCYLALRGLRTLSVRLRRHEENALRLARWLAQRPEVERVLHPALPDCPGHDLWRRDFTGATGLFSIVLKPVAQVGLAAMLEGLRLFPMGWSWGGYESLILPEKPAAVRTATRWTDTGPLLRIHAGLEDPDDLIADLEAGLARLKTAS